METISRGVWNTASSWIWHDREYETSSWNERRVIEYVGENTHNNDGANTYDDYDDDGDNTGAIVEW